MKRKSLKPLTRAGVAVVTSALLMAAPMTSFVSMAAENDTAAVQTVIASGLTMSTSYPGISVKAGDSISFTLDFTNSGAGEMAELSASALPDGFDLHCQRSRHRKGWEL